ncbi:putative STAS domain-containing protein [Janthinobacterium sp. HH01]|uniref:STAS domain-containing protein n=1 Tax=Rugamonas aquatica TaxID=2743357 RepID=A0A6A7NAL3_9BURK|nr:MULTISPECIES: STAS domain-containing protein [Oxalobacteraceae]ELX12065.1 putative STAS domain-containing protein [Janthinobacterium sp. HH01]MQA42051.1 STAS domain-containing protein [Rugamonas aquatica]
MSDQTGAAVARIALDGEMTIYRAADLKTTVLEALRKTQVLEIDLSGITELDTAGLQVLMLAKLTANADQRELRLLQHSPAVVEIFEMLDMGAFFGDALLIHA